MKKHILSKFNTTRTNAGISPSPSSQVARGWNPDILELVENQRWDEVCSLQAEIDVELDPKKQLELYWELERALEKARS